MSTTDVEKDDARILRKARQGRGNTYDTILITHGVVFLAPGVIFFSNNQYELKSGFPGVVKIDAETSRIDLLPLVGEGKLLTWTPSKRGTLLESIDEVLLPRA